MPIPTIGVDLDVLEHQLGLHSETPMWTYVWTYGSIRWPCSVVKKGKDGLKVVPPAGLEPARARPKRF